jgi:anti-sigma factor RsiW
MDCSSILSKISPFLDDELSLEERRLVSEHLRACDRCRRELEKLSMVSDHLDLLEDVSAPPFFAAGVKRRVRDRRSHWSSPAPFAERVRRVTMALAATALLCFSLLAGGRLGKGIYDLRTQRSSREDVEIVSFLGVDSFNGSSGSSLASVYGDLLAAQEE